MRLLSTNELETKRRQQEAQTIMRGAKVSSLVDSQIKKLNASRDELEAFKKAHEENQQKFLDANLQERLAAERRLASLQEDCAVALKPIRIEKEAVEELKRVVEEKELAAQHLEQEASRKLILARQKESVIAEKEKEIRIDLAQLSNGLNQLDTRERAIKSGESDLEERKQEFEKELVKKYEKLNNKQKLADDTVALYNSKSLLLDEAKELLANERARFESDRAALQTAFNEARKKGIM